MSVRTRNAYEPPSPDDGWRLLVMRKWPRGVPKQAVHTWDRDLGPSTSLLERWRHGKMDWDTFYREYEAEMLGQEERLRALAARAQMEAVTLLCGCKDEVHCHRSVLKRLVEHSSWVTASSVTASFQSPQSATKTWSIVAIACSL